MTLLSAIAVLALPVAASSDRARPSTVSCAPERGVARIVGAASDYAIVGHRVGDNALLLDNLIGINTHGDTRHDRRACPNPDGTWDRIELNLGSGKDTTDPGGDRPEFGPVPAEIEMTIRGGRQIDELYGHKGPDEIVGGRGRDYLLGRDGDDLLVGGAGDDEIIGFGGDDRLDRKSVV